MPLVQLSRLRSQVNALELHFRDPEVFLDSLTSLFLMYENKKSSTNIWLRKNSQFYSYNVPKSVISELESRIAVLSRLMPESALVNADTLWAIPYYESKKIAITLASNLPDAYEKDFLQRLQLWLTDELEESLIEALLGAIETKPVLLQSNQWLDLNKTWLASKDTPVVKLGLKALNKTLRHGYQNIPAIFSVLTPLLQKPQLAIQKELLDVIQALILLSEAETASFLIMIGGLFPKEDILTFLRKCVPLFDNYFQNEIRKALAAH